MQAHDQAEQERAQRHHHAQRLETVQFGVGIDGGLTSGTHVSDSCEDGFIALPRWACAGTRMWQNTGKIGPDHGEFRVSLS